VRLYPLYHPAAALYTPSMVEVLRADFARLPDLLAAPAPAQPQALEVPEIEEEPVAVPVGSAVADELEQMGLF
jgi:DNA polymerase